LLLTNHVTTSMTTTTVAKTSLFHTSETVSDFKVNLAKINT